MEIKRFYVSPDKIRDDLALIDGEEYYHMSKVLRHKVGFRIILSNNSDGMDYHAVITYMDKSKAEAKIERVEPNEAKTVSQVVLYQALPKGDKIELIVQKAAELGITRIVPFTSTYVNETKYFQERAQRIAIEACKQCGRAYYPIVEQLSDFDSVVMRALTADKALMAYENEREVSFKECVKTLHRGQSVGIIIGSEGGFSEKEAIRVIDSGIVTFSLGRRILRAETAAISTMTLIMYALGEMDI